VGHPEYKPFFYVIVTESIFSGLWNFWFAMYVCNIRVQCTWQSKSVS